MKKIGKLIDSNAWREWYSGRIKNFLQWWQETTGKTVKCIKTMKKSPEPETPKSRLVTKINFMILKLIEGVESSMQQKLKTINLIN